MLPLASPHQPEYRARAARMPCPAAPPPPPQAPAARAGSRTPQPTGGETGVFTFYAELYRPEFIQNT